MCLASMVQPHAHVTITPRAPAVGILAGPRGGHGVMRRAGVFWRPRFPGLILAVRGRRTKIRETPIRSEKKKHRR